MKSSMIKIDLEKKIAFIEIGGSPTHIEIQHSIDELLNHPNHREGMDEIWDFRTASITSINENELKTLANFVQKHIHKLANRVAYVVEKNIKYYSIGRMWMVYAEISNVNQEREIFYNIEDAEKWLLFFRQKFYESIVTNGYSGLTH